MTGTNMNNVKRKHLEKNGWKVGTVKEFLNLSPDETTFIELKIELSRNFKNYRRNRKLTQEQVARLLKSSQSRVAKMEAGDPSVSLDLLVRSLLALGASKKGVAQMMG
jgi:DNA-binding XRE family transcriptional regulator